MDMKLRILVGLMLCAAPSQAAPITAVDYVAANCPTCERVDAETFADGRYVIAFDESYRAADPRDFNGLIVEALFAAGSLIEWSELYSTYPMTFGFDGAYAFATSAQPTAWTLPERNHWGHIQALSWEKPADVAPVPEPAAWLMLFSGLCWLKKRDRKPGSPRK